MARTAKGEVTDTGILLSDDERLPMPKARASEPRIEKPATKGTSMKALLGVGVLALAAGAAGGFVARPSIAPDTRVPVLQQQVADTQKTAASQKERADQLAKDLEDSAAKQKDLEGQLAVVDKKQGELAAVAAASQAEKGTLETALAKAGDVRTNGDEITLQLVDKVLFKVGDDQLTDAGKNVLDRVGKALQELPEKQLWVQGRSDDTPIPPPPRKKRDKTPPPDVKFATNWELSAARALTVVHYLQDTAKIDPARLKPANRRIEIVLYPKKAKLEK